MTTGRVIDEDGHEAEGVLRANGIVSFTIGRLTRHVSIDDFAELGFVWKANRSDDESPATYREPVDSPRVFRVTGEGVA
ncbi:hypothetical protein [Paraburkholderia sp. C35]|uniref:hypothetical protein n=1 Tax=Paraburkholderia sp. C35 TaxID=2126993 RepID=UPI000D6A04FF|nr:hypothetical protein [Paraburkholderia sp. C35]